MKLNKETKKIDKIVFVTHRLNKGGAQKMLTFVANSSVEVANEVFFLMIYDETPELELDVRIKVLVANKGKKFPEMKQSVVAKFVEIFKSIYLLRHKIKEIKPDIVCAFGVFYVTLSILATLGLKTKVIGSERRSPQNLSIKYKTISKLSYSLCHGMVFQLEEAMHFYGSKIRQKSTVIPNPYLSTHDQVNYDIRNRRKTITAAAARLEFVKGFDILIKAFSIVKQKYHEYILIIYGNGDYEKEYGDLMDNLNIRESVFFPGLVDSVVDSVKDTTVFVLPSRFEGIPNVLIETMAVGIPTISCDCPPGGPRFLTNDGKNGILVPVESYEAIASAILRVIDDEEYASKISLSGMNITEVLESSKISKKWICFFEKINFRNDR